MINLLHLMIFFMICLPFTIFGQNNIDTNFSDTPGQHALEFKKHGVKFLLTPSYTQGTLTNVDSGDDYKNTILGGSAGLKAAFSPLSNLQLRTALEGQFSKREETTKSDSTYKLEGQYTKAIAQVGATLVLPSAELFVHYYGHYYGKDKEKIQTALISSQNNYSSLSLFTSQFGLVKRNSNWAVCLYYSKFIQSNRKLVKKSDGSTTDEEVIVFIPGMIGGLLHFDINSDIKSDLEFMQLDASDVNDETEFKDQYRDYYRVRANLTRKMNAFFLTIEAGYQSEKYQAPENINLETLANYFLSTQLDFGDLDKTRFFVSLQTTYGSDLQNVPEYKVKHSFINYHVGLGINSQF